MRGLRLLWAGIIASTLTLALFSTLQVAHGAVQVDSQPQLSAVDAAVRWLVEAHQNEDGGYTAFSGGAGTAPSDVAGTTDAILALSGAGYYVAAPYPDREQTPLDFLLENAEDVAAYAAQSGGANGKLILALTAAAQDPRAFGGYDFTISLTQHLSPTGQYNVVSPYEQGLAILAQRTVSDSVPASAVAWLLSAQEQQGELSGSWDDGFGAAGNTDATAMAIMALATVDEEAHGDALQSAVDYLRSQQLESGGWGYVPGLPESANSTALAVQALSAAGEDFYSLDGEWAPNGMSPLAALWAWQGESGAMQADFGEGPADDFFTTIQALPALAGRPYPLPARFEGARNALFCLATLQAEEGGWAEFAGSEPGAGGTSRAIRAILAHGGDLSAEMWAAGERDPLQTLEATAPEYIAGGRGGRIGRVMRAAAAAGAGVDDFGGMNLAISMTENLSPTGEYDSTAFGPFSHGEAMLGLLAAGETVDQSAVEWLLGAQASDGGWGDPDATGISLQALARLNGEQYAGAITSAIGNLRATQQADGGWGFDSPSSVNSTSEVAQALVQAGENPFSPDWSTVLSGALRSAADVALSQQGVNGCWPNPFGEGDDPYSTVDGIILLSLDPAWGSSLEAEAAVAEPTAETDETEVPEATATDEVVIEATEALPSPTAEEEVAQATAEATDAPVEETPEATATQLPAGADEDEAGEPLVLWIAAAIVLLALVVIYYRLTRSR